MKELDFEQLTLFPADFHANHSAQPEIGEEKMILAISGRKCLESSKNYGRLGLLEKMLLESQQWHSTIFSLSWKKKTTKQGRFYFQLAASARFTSGIDSPSWPTPMAMDGQMKANLNRVQMLLAGEKQFTSGNGVRSSIHGRTITAQRGNSGDVGF